MLRRCGAPTRGYLDWYGSAPGTVGERSRIPLGGSAKTKLNVYIERSRHTSYTYHFPQRYAYNIRVPTYPHSQLAARSAAIPTSPPSGAEFRERPPSGRAQRYLPTLAQVFPITRTIIGTSSIDRNIPGLSCKAAAPPTAQYENLPRLPNAPRIRISAVASSPDFPCP
jgi:hypothetical protein